MDRKLAREILIQVLAEFREKTYAELADHIDKSIRPDVSPPWQIEVQFFWDCKITRNLRVIASIDDGGSSACSPVTEDFILSPTGEFIDE